MKAILIMNEEHKNISRMLKVVRACCSRVLKGEDINYDDFDKILEFIVEYADKHHHKKEEDILFDKMVKHLGGTAEKVVSKVKEVAKDAKDAVEGAVDGVKKAIKKDEE